MKITDRRISPSTLIVTLIGAAVLAGCTTSPMDAKSKGPTFELQSTKSAKTVATCIAEKWENLYRVGNLNLRPTQNGYSVIQQDQVMGGKDIPFLADVDDRGTGSTTTYYNNAFSARKMDQAVIDCQK